MRGVSIEDRAQMVARGTGESVATSRQVLDIVKYGDVGAARAVIDIAQYFSRDAVWAARRICALLLEGPGVGEGSR